ncbi:MAG: cyclic nucleotide-binding domain-containing protein [Desulfobacula sp.]|nr:cyclic nucleotide-binding domain-containing protein [Desulfobacula sp.]
MLGPKFGTVKSYYKNQMIFKEGHIGNVGYLIKTGEVTIYKIIDDEKKILSKLGPGEVFGEMCIVTESPRTAFAKATEYCDLVIIDKDTLFTMLKQSPKLIQSITILLMKRLSNTLDMLDRKGDDSPGTKNMLSICSLLDLMARSDNDNDQGINYHAFCEKAMDIIYVNQTQIDNTIQLLEKLKVIEVFGEYQKVKTSGCAIKVVDSKSFLKNVKKYSREQS